MEFLRRVTRPDIAYKVLIAFTTVSILWKGGKSLEITWLLLALSAYLVGSALLHHWSDRERWQGIPILLWIPAALSVLWVCLAYWQSATANYGLDEVFRTAACIGVFFWAIRFSQRKEGASYERGITLMVRVLSIVTIAACAIGVVVYVFQPVNRFVGTFFDARFHTDYWPNAWAEYVLLTWPIVYYWAFRTWQGVRITAYGIADTAVRILVVALVVGCLLLSYSRGATIAFIGQLALWAGVMFLQHRDARAWKTVGVIAGLILLLSLGWFGLANSLRADVHDVLDVAAKVTFQSDEGVSSVSERSQFWRQATGLAADRPLFGWGPYSFRFVQPALQQNVLATSDHPHNVFLKLAAEQGWLAALLVLLIVAQVLLRGLDTEIHLQQKSGHHASFGILLVIGIAGVLAHNLIDYNLQFVGIVLPFWLLMGLLAGRVSYEQMRRMPVQRALLAEAIFVGILLLIAIVEGGYLVVSSVGRHAEAAGNYEKAITWYERARHERFSRDLHLSRAALFMQADRPGAATEALGAYFAQNDVDYRAWKRRGEIAMAEERTADAVTAYQQAYAYGRYNDIGIVLGYLEALLAEGRRDEVHSMQPEIDTLIHEYANAINYNLHFIALSPNVESFIDLAELMAELYPDESPLYYVLAARVDHHAQLERERITARPPGFLW